jgi:hypothetical protein
MSECAGRDGTLGVESAAPWKAVSRYPNFVTFGGRFLENQGVWVIIDQKSATQNDV